MGGRRRKPIPLGIDDEIVRALARSSSPSLHHVRCFRHQGKPYIPYEGGVPGLEPGTLVATGYAVRVVADGHHPTPDELATALDAAEAKRSTEGARGGS